MRRDPNRLRPASRLAASARIGVLLLLASSLLGCSRSKAARLEIDAAKSYWLEAGFVEMVPPVPLPQKPGTRISVWLRLPPGGQIEAQPRGDRVLLRYPAGTVAARVGETGGDGSRAWRVTDVRATRLEASGVQFFQNFRPAPGSSNTLVGFEWRRGDARGSSDALDGIASLVRATSPEPDLHALARARATHDCAGCHVLARREARTLGELGEVHRAADADGLFLIQTVLEGRAPLETYAPIAASVGNPYVDFRCDDTPATWTRGKRKQLVCPQKRVPVGYLDVARGLRDGEVRIRGLCASRRYLFDHLNDFGRTIFKRQREECGP
jgi:hypothetical protein